MHALGYNAGCGALIKTKRPFGVPDICMLSAPALAELYRHIEQENVARLKAEWQWRQSCADSARLAYEAAQEKFTNKEK